MKFNDAVFGVILLLFAAAMIGYTRSFPGMPGQDYGPALFPVLIGLGMGATGIVLIVGGVKRRRSEPFVAFADWVSSPRHLGNFAAILGGLLLYILLSDWLGFIVSSVLLLTGLLIKLRGRFVSSFAIALATTLVVHLAFTRLLLVPLPWGLLEPFAW